MDVAIAVPLGFFTMVTAIVVGFPLARAYARKVSNQSVPPAIPPEVQQRLEQLQQSMDSVAVEVERISEGQRFTTKLLAERTEREALPAASRSASR
jgi:hypothetical protein